MKRAFLAITLGISFCAISLPALAQTPAPKKSDDYGYIFRDDDLIADTIGTGGAQIKVIPMGRRDRLLRPRVHFVAEMLKSVEAL